VGVTARPLAAVEVNGNAVDTFEADDATITEGPRRLPLRYVGRQRELVRRFKRIDVVM